jgi:CRISPR-associated protein Csx17
LADRLANVLRRRFLDAQMRSGEGPNDTRNPTWVERRVSLADVATFIDGNLDERALEELMFGFTWVNAQRRDTPAVAIGAPLPRAYSLLRLLFQPGPIVHRGEKLHLLPDPAILSLLRAGRIADAVAIASRQLSAKGLRPRHVIDRGADGAGLGRRIAAALLIPTLETRALTANALLPDASDFDGEQPGDHTNEETINVR